MKQTLVLCKPDAVERSLVGEIISRFEKKGLKIAALRMLTIGPELAEKHYAEHIGKPFYNDLVDFIGRSPAVAMVIEGPEDTWEIVRKMMGATNAAQAEPGTIRGDFSALFTENLVHGSDSAESAKREIEIFFG
ncbi:MAG: nucleoside-diphosphate kinase [Actinomycetota bacterium]|jgi:nucleoside-diphosphate kinase|nr:nucleoside-diphosphate kinase [Actinomycetota bacterium]MCH2617231.1 nucleoside-diphosphate kinase [Acidimicrobiales bacterium]MED5229617.1 nucleoside-diphosphate kinase [Actinomycetota bacterium]MED5445238.1 nucleoside-diphosphate kinase [Actinomycetota bacterium]|tara:strand:- start:437 stop:838 length:402 start_codon:yes stop_codon:yes gene_type:complete